MRVPLLHADFEHGSYTKIAKALRKVWPLDDLSLMQSQNVLAVLFGYNSLHDAQHEATASFSIPNGSLSMKEIKSAVVWKMFERYGITPLSGTDLVPELHLDELAAATTISTEAKIMFEAIEWRLASHGENGTFKTMLALDEAGYLFNQKDDSLREALRVIDGIPNAKYQVRDGQVFVFERLIRLVEAVGVKYDNPDFADIALKLVGEAMVSPEDAVGQWEIVPAPYESEEVADGGVVIRHVPFDARLPGAFSSREAAQPALVKLLMGEVVTGIGEFEYRGQPMVLREPLNLVDSGDLMIEPPTVQPESDPAGLYLRLKRTEWRPGFAPIPESLFLKARDAELAWKQACASMDAIAVNLVSDIWADADKLDLGRLNTLHGLLDHEYRDQAEGLRSCYPELAMLSDDTLWSMFDTYQRECWSMRSWDPSRDEEFIFFLIGRLADTVGKASYAWLSLGKWVAYHWTRGNALDDAMWFGCQVRFNSNRVEMTAGRIATAMDFLESDGKATDLRGQKISTFGDMFRMGRKINAPIMLRQELQQFEQGQ
ncbi:hypothetical protein [Paraburkholderia fungorum]|uniref:hypothetical protein n=1 Tax=Paraburkholderia fungorum TaxID=134537 RepID=UPI0016110286|nr:hypothetical protein [Paraburkholderia fungorum]MBB5546622.1 hypothetical protein [Paraburkholderia fungorum]